MNDIWIPEAFEGLLVPIGELEPYTGNAKEHDETQISKIISSIKEFGFLVPVVADACGTLAAGEGRYLAAVELSMERIPCLRAEHLSEEQLRRFRLADNRVAETGWLDDLLSEELREVGDKGFTGFDSEELAKLITEVTANDLEAVSTSRPIEMAWVLVGIPIAEIQKFTGALETLSTVRDMEGYYESSTR